MNPLRHAAPLCLAVILLLCAQSPAAGVALTDAVSVAARTTIDSKKFETLARNCPIDQLVISHVVTASRPESTFLVAQRAILPNGTSPLIDGVYSAPAGVSVTAYNNGILPSTLDVEVLCGPVGTTFGGTAVAGVISIPAKSDKVGTAYCPDGMVATGGGYDASTVAVLGQHPDWRLGLPLAARADGIHDAADAWAVHYGNPSDTARVALTYAYCYPKPANTFTLVGSLTLQPGEHRFVGLTRANEDFVLGGGLLPTGTARFTSEAVWRYAKDSSFGAGFNFTRGSGQYSPGGGGVYGAFALDTSPSTPFARAGSLVKIAMTVTASGEVPRPPNAVPAVEFYNAARDHYFLTTIAKEISDLDTGVHPGWVRTGQSFNVYAAGSGGPLGRLPMCRFYGLPEAGLDSHFYTASALECLDVLAKFAGAWQLESGEVFQVQLPNIATGECPAGTVPVLRTWNQRTDSNHRYMTSTALRAQMLAQGSIAEGYGPNGVAFCVPG